jgi:uncharacterized protein (DUF885 family)
MSIRALATALLIIAVPSIATSADSDGSKFAEFVAEYFKTRFAFHPTEGTNAGDHAYDGSLDSYSRRRIDARITELERQLGQLEAIPLANLSPDDAIDAKCLAGKIRGELLDLKEIETWKKNPLIYTELPTWAIDMLRKRNFAPAAVRLRSVISRERAIMKLYAEARANLENPSAKLTDLAIDQAASTVTYFAADLADWAKMAANGDAELLNEFTTANNAVVEAAKRHCRWLTLSLRPHANGSFAVGAGNYKKQLEHEEFIAKETSLDDLLAWGYERLKKDLDEFDTAAKKFKPGHTRREVMEALGNDRPPNNDLLRAAKEAAVEVRKFVLEKKLVCLPEPDTLQVRLTPEQDRDGTTDAYLDPPGVLEAWANEAFYYITPVSPDPNKKDEADAHLRLLNVSALKVVTAHETYPGHYVQFLKFQRLKSKVRKLLKPDSNAEGWAHYCEQMMVEQGFGGDDCRLRLAQLQLALLRDCRYIVAIKLHTKGLPIDDAIRFFEENAGLKHEKAESEATRGVSEPMYLSYTLGKIQILRLRDEYSKIHKDDARWLSKFHEEFIAKGGLPVPLVREAMLGAH